MLCLSTLSIQGSSGIRNILLKTEGIVDTVEMCASNSTASIPDELSSYLTYLPDLTIDEKLDCDAWEWVWDQFSSVSTSP